MSGKSNKRKSDAEPVSARHRSDTAMHPLTIRLDAESEAMVRRLTGGRGIAAFVRQIIREKYVSVYKSDSI